MPMPISVTVNVTLRIFRCPTASVTYPNAQAMPINSTMLAIRAWRMPPKPATTTTTTPTNAIRPPQNIDDSLERISSFSMIGRPVKPIFTSGCRTARVGD